MRHHVRDCQGMIKTWDIRARKCVASFANDECGRPISHLALPPREACASYHVVPRRAVPRRGVLRRAAACCAVPVALATGTTVPGTLRHPRRGARFTRRRMCSACAWVDVAAVFCADTAAFTRCTTWRAQTSLPFTLHILHPCSFRRRPDVIPRRQLVRQR